MVNFAPIKGLNTQHLASNKADLVIKGNTMNLTTINNADTAQLTDLLEHCCCAPKWIESMLSAHPFPTQQALSDALKSSFSSLSEADWLIAFSGHPQIGNLDTLHQKYASTSSVASHEQAGMSTAEKSTLHAMLELNQQYLKQFGFIFIVCASGKSAPEMLELIKARINNSRSKELAIAAGEQAKITQLRLEKL